MQAASAVRELVDARAARQPSWVLLVELFIGLGWIRAAVSKAISPAWWRGDVVREFVAAMDGAGLPWWEPFLDVVVLEVPAVVAAAVLVGQVVAGLSLLAGRWLGTGLTVGMTMNLAFVLSGAIDPSVFYLISQAVIALWLYENLEDRGVGRRSLRGFAYAAVVVAAISGPFIRTLDPMRVIDDPATVLLTYAATIGVTAWIAQLRLKHGQAGPFAVQVGVDRIKRDTIPRGEVVPPRRSEVERHN